MNKKSLTGIIFGSYIGILGCTQEVVKEERAEVVGTVEYRFCDFEKNRYNLRLTEADIYSKEQNIVLLDVKLFVYHDRCELFQEVPEGTTVRAVGIHSKSETFGDSFQSTETYHLDPEEELIYPVKKKCELAHKED